MDNADTCACAIMYLRDRKVGMITKCPTMWEGSVLETEVVISVTRRPGAEREDAVILSTGDTEDEAQKKAQDYYNLVCKMHKDDGGKQHIATQLWDLWDDDEDTEETSAEGDDNSGEDGGLDWANVADTQFSGFPETDEELQARYKRTWATGARTARGPQGQVVYNPNILEMDFLDSEKSESSSEEEWPMGPFCKRRRMKRSQL